MSFLCFTFVYVNLLNHTLALFMYRFDRLATTVMFRFPFKTAKTRTELFKTEFYTVKIMILSRYRFSLALLIVHHRDTPVSHRYPPFPTVL